MSLFDDNRVMYDPLASRLRPSGLEEFVGQKNLVGEGKVLRRLIDQDMVSSMTSRRGKDYSCQDNSQEHKG